MSNSKPSQKKEYWFTAIVLTVTMSMLLLFLLREKSLPELGRIFSSLDPFWMLIAVATFGSSWVLEGICNWLLSRHLYPNWTFGRSFMIGMTGIFYCSITPFSAGGQPMQIYYMAKMGMEPGPSAAIISAKTLTHQCTMMLFSVILLFAQFPFFVKNVSNLALFTLLGFSANILLICMVILVSVNAGFVQTILRVSLNFLQKIHVVKNPEESYQAIGKHLQSFQEGFKTMGRDWKLYLLVCLITLAQLILGSYNPYCIYRAFHLHGASAWQIISAEVFATMAVTLIPLPGNSGGAEVSFGTFCHIFFGDLTTPALLVWRVLTYYSNILLGGILVFWGSRRYLGKKPKAVCPQTKETESQLSAEAPPMEKSK